MQLVAQVTPDRPLSAAILEYAEPADHVGGNERPQRADRIPPPLRPPFLLLQTLHSTIACIRQAHAHLVSPYTIQRQHLLLALIRCAQTGIWGPSSRLWRRIRSSSASGEKGRIVLFKHVGQSDSTAGFGWSGNAYLPFGVGASGYGWGRRG